jgi:hypothetical protein
MATKQWPVSYPCGVSRQIAGDHANFPLFPGVVISPDINVSGRERYCHQPEYNVGLRAQSTGNAPWLIALAIPVYFSAALSLSYWILDVNKPKIAKNRVHDYDALLCAVRMDNPITRLFCTTIHSVDRPAHYHAY